MVKSMTGFGRGEVVAHGRRIDVELKSVNHKFFEFSFKGPRVYAFLEDKMKAFLQESISRGKVDCYLTVETLESPDVQITVNHALAGAYVEALRELAGRYGLSDATTAESLSRFPDVLSVTKAPEDEEQLWQDVREAAEQALQSFLAMREAEGARLCADVQGRAQTILSLVAKVEARSPETVREYQSRLQAKLEEMLGENRVDEQRIVTEAAIFADKVAVAEETVRLRSHFDQMQKMLEAGGPVGRKLDFLVQEMNREANTIGSKGNDAQIAYYVVDMKAEIEKIREQIQNME